LLVKIKPSQDSIPIKAPMRHRVAISGLEQATTRMRFTITHMEPKAAQIGDNAFARLTAAAIHVEFVKTGMK